MSAKAISEATGKDIINRNLAPLTSAVKCRFASINENTKWEDLVLDNPWLKTEVLILNILFLININNS
jgi:ATP citrate (pro-S)-lyase